MSPPTGTGIIGRMHDTDGTAANGDVILATRDYGGTGPDLLFLPGGGRSLVDCDLLAPHLTPHFRVVAMDLRGHGFSSDGPWTWDLVLDDVDAVIAAHHLTDPAVVGHSLGGVVSAMHGARNPNALGVVNLDGHGSGVPAQYDGVEPRVVLERFAELKALQSAHLDQVRAAPPLPIEALDALIKGSVATYGVSHDFAREVAGRTYLEVDGGLRQRCSLDTSLDILGLVAATDFEEMYRACKAPLLVYNCVKQQALPPGSPEWADQHAAAFRRGLSKQLAALATELPAFEWIELEATHALIYEMPELVCAQVRDFLLQDRG
jgi:pimeloyl-ACP methyl ester carboxylesterase